jgi:hypothetical protein
MSGDGGEGGKMAARSPPETKEKGRSSTEMGTTQLAAVSPTEVRKQT